MSKELLLFTTPSCKACPEMKIILNELKSEVQGVKFVDPINAFTEEGIIIARKYRVMSAPTLIFLIDGLTVGRLNGLQRKDTILQMLEDY